MTPYGMGPPSGPLIPRYTIATATTIATANVTTRKASGTFGDDVRIVSLDRGPIQVVCVGSVGTRRAARARPEVIEAGQGAGSVDPVEGAAVGSGVATAAEGASASPVPFGSFRSPLGVDFGAA